MEIKNNSLKIKAPHLEVEWHFDNQAKFHEVAAGSNALRKWTCSKCKHVWSASPNNRTKAKNQSGCPGCSGRHITSKNSLQTKAPQLEAEWHPDNPKKFHEVAYGSMVNYLWVCQKCQRVWSATPQNRAKAKRPTGCPECPKVSLLDKVPHLAAEWHPDNPKKFHEVSFGSEIEYKWICAKGHVWSAPPGRRASSRSCGCWECWKLATEANSLATRAPHLEKEWHPGNSKRFAEVPFASTVKYNWICAKGHIWSASPHHRTAKRPSGCSECSNQHSKAELAIFMAVKGKCLDAVSGQRQILKSRRLELDIYVPSLKKAIEYDGVRWHSLPDVQERDRRKDLQCVEAGIQLLRISDVEYQENPTATTNTVLQWLSGL